MVRCSNPISAGRLRTGLPVLTALDRPNSYIGRSVPRPNLQRLTQGRGQYVSDVVLPRSAFVEQLPTALGEWLASSSD